MVDKDMMRPISSTSGVNITEPELILMSVAAMSDNRSAFDRLHRKGFDAEALLAKAREAGRQLAVESGFQSLVTRFFDRLPEINEEVLRNKPLPEKALAIARHQFMEEYLSAARNMPFGNTVLPFSASVSPA